MLKIDARNPKESAKDYVVRQLVYNIIHINLIPGQRIDADELSSQLNVSKNPVREAELELSQTRLIEIKPKIGVFVSYIDTKIVDEVRELRSVLESELARQACDILTKEQIDILWENVALWQMYMKRNDEEKIFQLDKEFHKKMYEMCGKDYWYELVNNISPHFDRTTILSFRCREVGRILTDHEELVSAPLSARAATASSPVSRSRASSRTPAPAPRASSCPCSPRWATRRRTSRSPSARSLRATTCAA